MNRLPIAEYNAVRERIMTECGISGDVWRNWLSGRTRVPLSAQKVIAAVVGEDVFTDERE